MCKNFNSVIHIACSKCKILHFALLHLRTSLDYFRIYLPLESCLCKCAYCTLHLEHSGNKAFVCILNMCKNSLKYTWIVQKQWLPIASCMFKNAIYSTLGFALNVTICKSLHFALLHLDILSDYLINIITHELCKVKCARLCTMGHMLHIKIWKILQFAVYVAPKVLILFLNKHGLAHENVQVIAHCSFWICNCAISCTTFWKFILHFRNIPMCKILHFAVQYFKMWHAHTICTGLPNLIVRTPIMPCL